MIHDLPMLQHMLINVTATENIVTAQARPILWKIGASSSDETKPLSSNVMSVR